MSTTGQRIGDRMRELGLTQNDLAKLLKEAGWPKLGHQTTITRIVNGDRALKLDEGFALAGVLGITASYLAGYGDKEPTSSCAAPVKVALDRAIQALQEIKEGL